MSAVRRLGRPHVVLGAKQAWDHPVRLEGFQAALSRA